MKGKIASSKAKIAPGTYPATLEEVHAFTNNKYQSNELEPILNFTWNFGKDEAGNTVKLQDNFVRLPRDSDGYPILNDASKLYERISALYGERFDVKHAEWELELPRNFDHPSALLSLPHYDERKDEGFMPVKVESILVNSVECIGREAQVTVAEKGDFMTVKEVVPMPKKSGLRRSLAPIGLDEGMSELPV